MNIIKTMNQQDGYTIILSLEALMDKLISKEQLESHIMTCQVGTIWDPRTISEELMYIGYERVTQVESQGQFAIRGGIIDIYPLTEKKCL